MHHSDFVSLHLHTEYSLLDGAIRIKELVERGKEFRMPALAMTDHGNLFGAVEFYKQVKKAGIKPIIGCEIYIAPASRLDRGGNESEGAAFHFILLARDNTGYRNLVTLVTKAYLEGFYYKPRIDMDLLEQYSGGLIGLSACLKGEIPFCLQKGYLDRARERALQFKHILGPDNFYLEIQENGLPEQRAVNKQLVELSRELHIGLVATNDCHYLKKEDAKAHDILLCIQTAKTLKDVNRMKLSTRGVLIETIDAVLPDVDLRSRERLALRRRALGPRPRADRRLAPSTMLSPYSRSGEPAAQKGPTTVDSVASAGRSTASASTSIESPSASDQRMNSWRCSSVISPVSARISMACSHSARSGASR